MIKVPQLQVTIITQDIKFRLFSSLKRLHHGTDHGCYPEISLMFDWEATPHRRICSGISPAKRQKRSWTSPLLENSGDPRGGAGVPHLIARSLAEKTFGYSTNRLHSSATP